MKIACPAEAFTTWVPGAGRSGCSSRVSFSPSMSITACGRLPGGPHVRVRSAENARSSSFRHVVCTLPGSWGATGLRTRMGCESVGTPVPPRAVPVSDRLSWAASSSPPLAVAAIRRSRARWSNRRITNRYNRVTRSMGRRNIVRPCRNLSCPQSGCRASQHPVSPPGCGGIQC